MKRFLIDMVSSNAAPSPNWGSLLHGMLIEHLAGIWGTELHSEGARPLSQWVEPLGGARFRWHVQIMDERLALCFEESCAPGSVWRCRHNHSDFTVVEVTAEQTGLVDYIRGWVDYPAGPQLSLIFKTAATHKSRGRYVLYPTPELIAGSIRSRLTGGDSGLVLTDEDLEELTGGTEIVSYHLQTVPFSLEGSRVTGYVGRVGLRLRGPDSLIRFGHMLYGLAEWYGVGIKTALGMGGCLVVHE